MKHQINKRILLSTFASSVSLGAILAAPSDSEAAWIRYSGGNCAVYGGSMISGAAYGTQNDSSTSGMSLQCSITDVDTFRKQDVTTLNVHVYDGNPTAYVQAETCAAFYDGVGGQCSSLAATSYSGTGMATLAPSLGAFASAYAADFGYLMVYIAPKYGSTRSSLRGYFVAN